MPVLGYNFSLGGVCGRVTASAGRGGAVTLGMDGPAEERAHSERDDLEHDLRPGCGARAAGFYFSRRIMEPAAEISGRDNSRGGRIRRAARRASGRSPMPTMRQQPRLVYQPRMYQRLIDLLPSPNNMLELCVGTLAEMTEDNIYDAIDSYSRQNKIAYIHLRNVVGKVPHYRETFIDEGDVDMLRILAILHRNHFDGVMIPDHTPANDLRGALARRNGAHAGFHAGSESDAGIDNPQSCRQRACRFRG